MINEAALRVAVEKLRIDVEKLVADFKKIKLELDLLTTPLPMAAYHEDMGPVLWWRVPIEEAPYCGIPHDSNWLDGYYTHFTPLPQVTKPDAEALNLT